MEMAGQAIATGAQRQPWPLLASRSGLKTPGGDSHSVHGGCSGLLLTCGQSPTFSGTSAGFHSYEPAPPLPNSRPSGSCPGPLGVGRGPMAQLASSAAPSGKWQQLSLELKQVQSSLHQQSAAHLDQHMADDSEDRLSKLEVDMREIKEQNHKFESWFQDAAQSNQEANHKLHMVANQGASHQTQLSNLEQAVTQNSTTLQAVNSELREEMSRGFGNIEQEATLLLTPQAKAGLRLPVSLPFTTPVLVAAGSFLGLLGCGCQPH